MAISFGDTTSLVLVIASVFTGILLMVAMLVVYIVVNPIPPGAAQAARVLLSLGAGLAAAGLLGSLDIEGPVMGVTITAGGGFAVFIVVYLFEPGIVGSIQA
jgi:hypothetical protein